MNALTSAHQLVPISSPAMRAFRVTRIVNESSIIKSFWLKPQSEETLNFVPGEYLVFEVPAGPNGETLKREYSISGSTDEQLRVSIKLEESPNGTTYPDGLVSTYFHKSLKENDVVCAFGPTGKFLLDRNSDRPVVLLSGGVGQTPLIAMAHDLAQRGTCQTQIIHACENGEVHALRDELVALCEAADNLDVHFVYRTPTQNDKTNKRFDSEGVVTKALLQTLLPVDDYTFYLCGPGPFMQAMFELLLELGIAEERINYEFFGPATVLKRSGTNATQSETKRDSVMATSNDTQPIVKFGKSGIEVAWDPSLENLLDFAEEHGLMPDFSCRAGTCDSCKTKLLSGETEYISEPMERPAGDDILICCSAPTKNITLDL
ncbi:2Fe-2S iron-sulfur cluster-binding protein [Maritalea porphyrae]|uniref:2Fe-2S iron-sulfur cluster-binding protein n=1 Tax=Maritalea porphyrae TaxID=880732 RepID=UPI0022AF6E1F|nr:2Fe-2S iron-sulfur cluster-binding protein [Maritalea porphyrae]MCZ4271257.1 FAD-binding oxidoreductase [Maritalea porphyrae]